MIMICRKHLVRIFRGLQREEAQRRRSAEENFQQNAEISDTLILFKIIEHPTLILSLHGAILQALLPTKELLNVKFHRKIPVSMTFIFPGMELVLFSVLHFELCTFVLSSYLHHHQKMCTSSVKCKISKW